MATVIEAPKPDVSSTSDESQEFPLPQYLLYPSTTPPKLITQGAEARVYKTSFLLPSRPCALKYRPSKPYRHPILDQRLTRHRILSEARILQKCRREGVAVPAPYWIDESAGLLAMEWVSGPPVRVQINEWLRRRKEAGNHEDATVADGAALVGLMRRIGSAVGRMHKIGIIHGDLTTSNMMLRPWEKGNQPLNGSVTSDTDEEGRRLFEGEIVIIDFGLASQGSADEDRAVDLYVLERAFASTHPRAEGLFSEMWDAYQKEFKAASVVLKKLEDVRMRGRKRSMLG